jgi:hypothetical protein
MLRTRDVIKGYEESFKDLVSFQIFDFKGIEP